MEFDELLHQSEANSGTFMGASGGSLDAVEALEQAGELARGHPDPGISNLEHGMRLGAGKLNVDAAREGELEGVGEEIEDDLLPHVSIDIDTAGEGWTVDIKPQTGS